MCKINGRLVTVNELKNFMSNYIEIHGQNDNQQLLDSRTHIKYLDNFTGDKLTELQNLLLSNGYNYKVFNNETDSCVIIELPRN